MTISLVLVIEKLKRRGGIWFASRVIKRILLIVLWFMLLPAVIALHLCGYRRVTVFTDRIGHLAAELDCFVKEQRLGHLPNRRWFILAPPARVANPHLLNYWRTHIRVIDSYPACFLLEAMTLFKLFMVFDISDYLLNVNTTAKYYEVNAEWGSKKPILELTNEDRRRGKLLLREMGVPENAWTVCFHSREGGFSPEDEALHAHRNSDVLNLIPAMNLVVANGGWCFRMGDASMTRLPEVPGVIDYAHHPAKSAWMDLFLCAQSRFFVGNSSGVFILSSVFGVPCALVNMIPISTMGYAPHDISIPKLLRQNGDYLKFTEIFDSPIADYRLTSLYRSSNIEIVENSPEDICELVREMLEQIKNNHEVSLGDKNIKMKFSALLKPGNYSYGAASSIGVSFLRKHINLLN